MVYIVFLPINTPMWCLAESLILILIEQEVRPYLHGRLI